MTKKNAKPAADLPPDVLESDTAYPEWGEGVPHDRYKELDLGHGYESGWSGSMTFYRIEGRTGSHWVLTTLPISAAKRGSGATDRTYGIGVSDSKVYTVGRGPHVKAVVQVFLSKANLDRLKKYVELWKKGMADAGAIRDRISSRRAQGQLHRAAGRTSWMW